MSVAFRRDGDEEHLEPKFEIPIPPGPNRVTARGLALIRARVAELLAELDGLVQSGADEAAVARCKRDLRYWQTREVTAQLIPPADGHSVDFGTAVEVRMAGKLRSFAIVGDDEADPAQGRIAFSAPLARAMAGAEVGDWLPFAGKEDAIEILSIRALPADEAV